MFHAPKPRQAPIARPTPLVPVSAPADQLMRPPQALAACCCCCWAPPSALLRFCFQSLTAALMASSASMLQCSLTGGRLRCLAMSLFLMVSTSSTALPLILHTRGAGGEGER